MKLNDIVSSYEVLKKLSTKHFSNYRTVRNVFNFLKKIDEELKFYITEEQKLIQKYAKKDQNGMPIYINDGTSIELESAQSAEEYSKAVVDLKNTEIDNIEKLVLRESDFQLVEDLPTPSEMGLLFELIDWAD